MTAPVTDKSTDIKRCPVCKIDRKGRFILANQQAQNLFGLTEVELFGRPFADFLQAADRPAFLQLIKNRNPYETTYDSVRLQLVTSKGQTIPATLIVSVNFGGGNPANYQIVIRPEDAPIDAQDISSGVSGWEELVRVLLSEETPVDHKSLVRVLSSLIAAATVAVHDLGQPECPVVVSTGPNAENLPPLDNAFLSRGETSPDAGSKANSDEIRATYSLPDGKSFLIRILPGPASSKEQAGEMRKRAEAAASLIHAIRAPLPPQTGELWAAGRSPSLSRLFDCLSTGFVLVDQRGRVQEHNKTFDKWFSIGDDFIDLSSLIQSIGFHAGGESAATLEALLTPSGNANDPLHFSIHLSLTCGTELELEVVRTEDDLAHHSIGFVFRETEERFPHQIDRRLSMRAGKAAVELIKSSVAAAAGVWEKLEHEHFNELKRDGGFYLSCMSHHVETLAGTVADLERMLKLVGENEPPQTIDLRLLVDRLTEEMLRSCPTLDFTVRHSDLPKINAPLHKLSAILRDTMLVMVQAEPEKKTEITVAATFENKVLVILLRDSDSGMSPRQTKSLFRLRRRAPQDLLSKQPGLDVGLALAHEVVTSLGGSLEVQAEVGKGATYQVTLPINEP